MSVISSESPLALGIEHGREIGRRYVMIDYDFRRLDNRTRMTRIVAGFSQIGQ